MEKISVSAFFSEFLKLLHCYGDVIVTNSRFLKDVRITFKCHIMSPARMTDLMCISLGSNTWSNVYSYDFSDLGESPEDSCKKLIWDFVFKPHSEDMKLNGEIMPMTLFDFYTMVLRDAKKKHLINEQEVAHFESYLEKVDSMLISVNKTE